MMQLIYGGESLQIRDDQYLHAVEAKLEKGEFPGLVRLTSHKSPIWVNLSGSVPFVFRDQNSRVG